MIIRISPVTPPITHWDIEDISGEIKTVLGERYGAFLLFQSTKNEMVTQYKIIHLKSLKTVCGFLDDFAQAQRICAWLQNFYTVEEWDSVADNPDSDLGRSSKKIVEKILTIEGVI